VASYIPQLARVNPEYYGISICTVDGQRYDIGDTEIDFCAQSTSKPITYAIACEHRGEDLVHKHVGREPSGRNFNELVLNDEGLPHNPLINSGAIMTASLVQPNLSMARVSFFSCASFCFSYFSWFPWSPWLPWLPCFPCFPCFLCGFLLPFRFQIRNLYLH